MKKRILLTLAFIAFILLISEPVKFSGTQILIKLISLLYLWLLAKANNYFYQG